MAVVLYKNADKTVDTIAERNNIPYKIDNMVVTVIDAIADPDAGAGIATYRYNAQLGNWILISKSSTETMSFDTEELLISNGEVNPSNVPSNNQIWDIKVIDGDVIIADIRIEDIDVSATTIQGLGDYNGYKLRFAYAYGSTTQQISTYVDERLSNLTGNDIGDISDFEGELV